MMKTSLLSKEKETPYRNAACRKIPAPYLNEPLRAVQADTLTRRRLALIKAAVSATQAAISKQSWVAEVVN
ncbi:MAG: hypothetical protein ABF946_09715, partial [Acetobacter papayae]